MYTEVLWGECQVGAITGGICWSHSFCVFVTVLGAGRKEKKKALGAGNQAIRRNVWHISMQVRWEAKCAGCGISF